MAPVLRPPPPPSLVEGRHLVGEGAPSHILGAFPVLSLAIRNESHLCSWRGGCALGNLRGCAWNLRAGSDGPLKVYLPPHLRVGVGGSPAGICAPWLCGRAECGATPGGVEEGLGGGQEITISSSPSLAPVIPTTGGRQSRGSPLRAAGCGCSWIRRALLPAMS